MPWLPVPVLACVACAINVVFPLHLRADRACPVIPEAAKANTWVELDQIKAAAHKRGLFHVRLVQQSENASETTYVFAIDDCVGNGWQAYEEVVFKRGVFTKPIRRRAFGGWGMTYP